VAAATVKVVSPKQKGMPGLTAVLDARTAPKCGRFWFGNERKSLGGGRSTMECKSCKSHNIQRFDAELTASFAKLEGLTKSPVYVCQSILVCLDCGFAELQVPERELGQLKDTIPDSER
jgi:hypothetical protein